MNELQQDLGCWKWLRGVFAILGALMLLWFGIPAAFYLLMDRGNEPLCHKEALVQVWNWFDLERSDDLPNVDGRSMESLSKLNQYLDKVDVDKWNARYRYVPGLRRGDPGDLVLMYMKKPTRFIWHSNPQTIFHEAKWMLVPLDFTGAGPNANNHVREVMNETGEEAERVSLEEFKSRLQNTLKFLQDNNRPHWQTVVAENEKFLKSLENE